VGFAAKSSARELLYDALVDHPGGVECYGYFLTIDEKTSILQFFFCLF